MAKGPINSSSAELSPDSAAGPRSLGQPECSPASARLEASPPPDRMRASSRAFGPAPAAQGSGLSKPQPGRAACNRQAGGHGVNRAARIHSWRQGQPGRAGRRPPLAPERHRLGLHHLSPHVAPNQPAATASAEANLSCLDLGGGSCETLLARRSSRSPEGQQGTGTSRSRPCGWLVPCSMPQQKEPCAHRLSSRPPSGAIVTIQTEQRKPVLPAARRLGTEQQQKQQPIVDRA